MAARDADIKLLIGVATGAPDGDSEQLIREQLNEIMSKIKVDVTLKTTNFRSQIRKGMSDAAKNGKFSVSVSEIKIGANAIKDFKKQLGAVINTLTLDKGVSITIDSKQIGKATGEVKELKQQTEEAARSAAAFKVQMEALTQQSKQIGSGMKGLSGGTTDHESAKIAELSARYRQYQVDMETARNVGVTGAAERRTALEQEGQAILNDIALLKQQKQTRQEEAAETAARIKANVKESRTIRENAEAARKAAAIRRDAAREEAQAEKEAAQAAKATAEQKVRLRNLGKNNTKIGSGLSAITNGADEAELVVIAALQARYQALEVSLEELKISGVDGSSERISALEAESVSILGNIELIKQQQKARADDAAEAKRAAQVAPYKSVKDAYTKITTYLNKNPRISETFRPQLEALQNELYGVVKNAKFAETGITDLNKSRLTEIISQFSGLDTAITEAGQKGNTFVGMLSAAYKKFGGWMLVTKSLTTAWRAMIRMVENVRTLDAAMTELKKVTDETSAAYAKFFDEASVRAKKLGATLADTITATADFARLGYSIADASTLADAAVVYKNVGDGIENISQASESIISTMKAFGIEAANVMTIVDKFNIVGNEFATSSTGIGEALLNSASALAAAGNTLDESIALITAANEVIQNPEKVGTALKTVSMYIRAAKTEAEEAGIATDGMANSVSELRDEILALTDHKVDIMIDENTYKNTVGVIGELSKVWNDLTDTTRTNITELIGGGVRNANVISALINNFETVERVLDTSANSAGSALAENEKYLNSINGKVAQFQAAFEKLSASFVSSGLIKSVVDGGTVVLETLTAIIDKLGAFPALISTITAAVTAYSGAKGKNLGIFDVVDGKVGLSGGITDWSAANKNIAEYNKVLGSSIQTQQIFIKYLDGTDDALSGYLKSLKGGKASMSGYKAYCKQAGIETKAFGASSKAAALGVTALNTAINMLISLGIGLVIQGIITGITHLINASDEAIEKANELTNAFNEFRQTNSDNIDKLQSLKEEFETLSHGVSRYGENISLTADEYDRYKQIVQTIVDISPALSEGYSIENGYLADKNELIERAIELQEQQYKSELRQMTTTEKLSEVINGYAASYDKLKNSDILTTDTDLSNNMWKMFRVDDRDVTPEFVGNSGDNKSRYLSEQIMKALGVTDIGKELEKYTNEYGYYQWGDFWEDYADQVSNNIGRIAASINYTEIGFESLSDFEAAVEKTKNAAVRYGEARDGLEKANQDVADQLKLVAQNNAAYDDLSTEAQNIVSNFIDRFGVDDVTKKNFWGKIVPDEDAITDIKVQINDFIDKLTPEVQNAMSGLFDLKGLFDAGDIHVDEFQETVNAIISDLEAAGFDDNTIKYLRLSLETDMVEQQLSAVREAIGGVDGEYDALLGEMSAQELKIAYNIISEEGSMTFEELQEKIEWLKYANSDMVNPLDFSDMIAGLDDAKDGLDSIISAMDRLNSGTAMTKQQLANLALQYPKLLEQADLFVDGSIDGQKQLLNSILETNEAEYDAQLDTKIAELKATEQAINDQLAMETEKANIIADIKNLSVNGQVQQEEALIEKMNELNDLQGRNYVAEKNGELTVNEEALNKKLGAEVEYGQQATENIWEPYANTIKSAHTQGFSKSLEATNNYGSSLFAKIRNIASSVWGALSQAVKDATTGNWQGISHYFQSAVSGAAGDTSIDAGDVVVTFDGTDTYVGTDTLDDWISQQEQASAKRIAALEDFKQRTVNAYRNLEALRGLDLTGIYGSAGSSYGSRGDSGSGSSSDDDSDIKDKIKTIEEYIADIDAYYEAEKRLQAAQERANSLAKKLKYAEDPAEKIKLSGDLIDAYKEEAAAEKDLMALKKSTIASNVGALRALGFEVRYNSETNELYIKNLEHLNELTASSAGEYDTLQEATNALRKETENLIDVTEQLNDDNIDAASSIEDLGYQVQETKNNIIDYIEEIYKKQTDAYQKIIDLRKEMIESAKDEFDYEADIADKVKEIADLQARIDQLSLDDSRSAQTERSSLMQELEEKQKDLADTQRDHSVEAQTDALDKMGEDYEADKESELELLRSTVNSSEELWTAFYQTLLGQSVSVGASIDAEISSAWIRAAEAVRQYSDAVGGVSGVGTVVSNVPKYHDGGVVNEANIGKDEVLAILQKGEVVLNDAKQESLYQIIDFQAELSKRLGVAIGTMQAPASPSLPISTMMQSATQDIVSGGTQGFVFEPHIEVSITHNGNMADSDAKDYGEKIAGVAIDKLYSAFERRGISSTRGSRLKP